jgi:hypothetical protein
MECKVLNSFYVTKACLAEADILPFVLTVAQERYTALLKKYCHPLCNNMQWYTGLLGSHQDVFAAV